MVLFIYRVTPYSTAYMYYTLLEYYTKKITNTPPPPPKKINKI